MGQRNAAKVGADTDHNQPLIVARFDASRIGLRVGKAIDVDVLSRLDLLLGPVRDDIESRGACAPQKTRSSRLDPSPPAGLVIRPRQVPLGIFPQVRGGPLR